MKNEIKFAKSRGELAAMFGCSRRNVERWAKDKSFPKKEKNGYNVEAVKKWINSNAKLTGSGRSIPYDSGETDSQDESIASLKRKELKLDVKMKELELQEKRGELMKVSDMKELAGEILSPIARRLKDLAASMALKCNPSDPALAKSELRDWANETLEMVQDVCKRIKSPKK